MATNVIQKFDGVDISKKYAKFRPTYPSDVSDTIVSYMQSRNTGFDVAVDVACGSGQSTFLLCDFFRKVIGVDISTLQIEQARLKGAELRKTNVEFIVGDAHSLPLEASSVDLLTCGAAWHWLDADLFYTEAKRVLKPGGCIAVYGYGFRVTSNQRIMNAFDMFIDELFKTDCFSVQNLHPLNNYEAVKLPFSETQRYDYDFPQSSTIDQVMGLFSSVSMYTAYCERFPENTFLQKIRAGYEMENGKCDVEEFTFPGYVILGKN